MTRINQRLGVFLAFFFTFAILSSFLLSGELVQTSKITSFEELEKAITRAEELVQASPENPALHCQLAELLLLEGKYEEAEHSLDKALKIEPNNVQSLVVLSNLYRRKFEFDKGMKLLEKAKILDPEKAEVLSLEARYAIDRMDFKAAKAAYQDMVEKDPASSEAIYGIAEVFYWEDRFEEADQYIAKCLSLDPVFSPAYQLQSRIHRLRQENDQWRELGRKAVDLSPFDDDARANLANILMRGEGKMEEGYEQYQIALKINPYSLESHSYLGTGWTPKDYKEQIIEGSEETVNQVKALLKEGDEHLLNLDFTGADEAFSKVLDLMPSNIKAMIAKGTLNYHQKKYDASLRWFFKVLDISPGYGLGHYGVFRNLLRKKDRINVKFSEIENNFAAKDTPEPPSIKDVFINYERLNPDLQKILRLSVQPLKHYLKTLKIAGATFYIIPFHKLLWESPYLAGMKGTRTFDLRLWDDVKGCGGFHSTSGEDWEKDVKYQRFNVVAHEFAHQVHSYLTEEQRKEIKRLFLKAKKERKTLDFYADFNEWEYFAVGVEACVSEEKLADQKLGYGHTRRELLEKDLDLYNFIESLDSLESYVGSEILGFIRKTNSTFRREGKEKTIKAYEEALEQYGSHPELLGAMADIYRDVKEYDKAKEMHQRIIHEFPEHAAGYLGLTDDYLFFERDITAAIALLEDQVKAQPDAVNILTSLGQLYYLAGDLDRMEKVMKRALSIDPFPDPYSGSDPYYYLSQGFIDRENYAEAENLLRFSMDEIDKNNPLALAELAFISLRTGKEEEGQELLEQALELGQRLPRVQEVQALYLVSQGKEDEARNILEKLTKQVSGRIETKIQLARLVLDSEPDNAKKLIDDGLKIAASKEALDMRMAYYQGIPGQISLSRLYTIYGDLLEKEGRIEESLARHHQAWNLFKYNYSSAVSLVKLYIQNGNKKKAKRAFEQLKSLNLPESYIETGEELLKKQRKKKSSIQPDLSLQPDSFWIDPCHSE